ncbi:FAD dependent oxidoreductase [Penicillium taxi]|uniref:FAD dependent oxidoreductase n=1 Tax=Penicillium taxi TaxID=168475 RepID=UPI00254593BB|nr:FAD dependent oxidoreductase [Penicillium taxi]KAJ5894065.1 FAD dependent oxidoreductase [Penicillium taxi]
MDQKGRKWPRKILGLCPLLNGSQYAIGAALAYLSETKNDRHIILIDKNLKTLVGSTGHAPGFVGQLNESPVLTRLAQDTVSEYSLILGGFNPVGALGLSSTPSGMKMLRHRLDLARSAGLPAEIITLEAAASLAPDFINAESKGAALHFPSDGTGDVGLGGATVILATGIWTSALSGQSNVTDVPITKIPVPIVPVAHPYTSSLARTPRAGKRYPLFRCYGHPPLQLHPTEIALGSRPSTFDNGNHAELDGSFLEKPFNGIFVVTPDNLPLAGKVSDVSKLWLYAAIWVTTAGGTAKLVSRAILRDTGHPPVPEDEHL